MPPRLWYSEHQELQVNALGVIAMIMTVSSLNCLPATTMQGTDIFFVLTFSQPFACGYSCPQLNGSNQQIRLGALGKKQCTDFLNVLPSKTQIIGGTARGQMGFIFHNSRLKDSKVISRLGFQVGF